MDPTVSHAWLDDRLVPVTALAVPADDPGWLVGDGLFETMLVRQGRVVRLDRHLARFEASRRALALPPPPTEPRVAIAAVLAAADDAARLDEVALRLTLSARPTLVVQLRPIGPRDHARRAGLDLWTLPERRGETFLARHKALAWAANAVQRRLHRAGADPRFEGLWLDPEGHVLEGTSTNLFAVVDASRRLVYTPPLAQPILPGTARAAAIEALVAAGCEVREAPLDARDFARADELFATNATLPVAPVARLDGQPHPGGAVASALWHDVRAALEGDQNLPVRSP